MAFNLLSHLQRSPSKKGMSEKPPGHFKLLDVLKLAETLDVPQQATLPVYINDIHAVMDIGRYCKDKRSGHSTSGKPYFKYQSSEFSPVQRLLGSELEKMGGAELMKSYKDSLKVAHDGSLETMKSRLTAQQGP